MKAIGKQTLIYGLGVVLSKAVGFVMLPVYTRYLTPADYGTMELIAMTLDVIAIVAGAKLALGIFRYYHKADTEQEKYDVVSTALIALSVSYVFVGVISFLSASLISNLVFGSGEQTGLIRLAAANLAVQSLVIVPLTYARLRNRSLLFVASNAAKLVIGLTLNIILVVHAGMGVRGVFIANLVATVLVGGAMAAHVIREVGLRFSRNASRDLLRYGVPLIGTQLAAFVLAFGNRYFLKAATDTAAVGIYSLAVQFGVLLAVFGYMPFEMVWEPARFEIAKRPDRDAILSRGFVYMSTMLLVVGAGISLFAGDVLRVMAAPAFHSAADLVPIILIAYLFQGWTQMQDMGILIKEKTEYITAANWTAAVVAVAGFALLIPKFHGLGAAIATSVAFAARYAMVYTISQRLWPVRYSWAPVLRACALAVLICGVGVLLPTMTIAASIGVRSLLLVAFLVGLWHTGVLSATDRALLRRFTLAPGAMLASLRTSS